MKWLHSLVPFSRSVVSNSLRPHGLQHTRPPCPSPTPGAYSNSCPPSQWSHPTISSSVIPFSSCPQPFPASASFQVSQFFASGGQNTGVSASASILPMNIQDWFPLGWTGWIACSPRDSQEFFEHQSSKTSSLQHSVFFMVQLSHPYMTTGKTIALTRQTFVGQVMSLLFNILSRLVIACLPRSKHLLIWMTSLFESLQIKANIYLQAPEGGRLKCLPVGLLHLWHLCSHRYHKIWQPYGYWLLQSIPPTPGLPNANTEPTSPKAQAQHNANNCPNPH